MRDYRNRDNISINPEITNCNNHGWTYVFNSFSENPSITVTLLNFPYTENPSFLEWNFPMKSQSNLEPTQEVLAGLKMFHLLKAILRH